MVKKVLINTEYICRHGHPGWFLVGFHWVVTDKDVGLVLPSRLDVAGVYTAVMVYVPAGVNLTLLST